MSDEKFSNLYDAVTAQLEHEFDAAGFDGDTTTLESLERIKAAVEIGVAEGRAAS